MKPTFVKPPKDPPRLNYVVDITTKQHGEFFYFIATYCCPFPDAIEPTFEARFARLRHVGGGRFHLAYMRHADKWAEIPFSQTLDESIASVRDDPWFQR
ncbi:MAG: hypothetical protein N2C14_03990 [Planctomycetales bacterium]